MLVLRYPVRILMMMSLDTSFICITVKPCKLNLSKLKSSSLVMRTILSLDFFYIISLSKSKALVFFSHNCSSVAFFGKDIELIDARVNVNCRFKNRRIYFSLVMLKYTHLFNTLCFDDLYYTLF